METLNFIDISSWQSGLDLKNLFSANPDLAGVIVKATGGRFYTNEYFDGWIRTLINLKKPFGFYHYLNDGGYNETPENEATRFVNKCREYFGKGAPAADYEGLGLRFGTDYLKRFLDTVYDMTGVKAFVYCSQSVIASRDFSAIVADGYPLWLAQYGSSTPTGFRKDPWQKGSVAPFEKIWMHQYTETGRLNGWKQNLDLDLFYGNLEDWNNIVKGKLPVIDIPTQSHSVDPGVIEDVLDGKYGTGLARVSNLKQAGFDYETVQSKINELYRKAEEINTILDSAGEYGDLLKRIVNII